MVLNSCKDASEAAVEGMAAQVSRYCEYDLI